MSDKILQNNCMHLPFYTLNTFSGYRVIHTYYKHHPDPRASVHLSFHTGNSTPWDGLPVKTNV